MAESKTQIGNLSLSHLGTGKQIANIDTENSQEANACRLFYPFALNDTLRSKDWGFGRTYADLTLIEEDPNDDWGFSYQYPTDCVAVRKILSGVRNDSKETAVKYLIAGSDSARIILTDQGDAVAKYTRLVEETAMYPSDFTICLSLRLAYFIAPLVTKGDVFKHQERMMSLFDIEMTRASAHDSNEDSIDQLPDSEFISGRDG